VNDGRRPHFLGLCGDRRGALAPCEIHDIDLAFRGPPEVLLEKREIIVVLLPRLQRMPAIRDLLAVPREERAAVRPRPAREPADIRTIPAHGVDLHVAVAHARESDRAVWRECRPRVIAGRRRQRRREIVRCRLAAGWRYREADNGHERPDADEHP